MELDNSESSVVLAWSRWCWNSIPSVIVKVWRIVRAEIMWDKRNWQCTYIHAPIATPIIAVQLQTQRRAKIWYRSGLINHIEGCHCKVQRSVMSWVNGEITRQFYRLLSYHLLKNVSDNRSTSYACHVRCFRVQLIRSNSNGIHRIRKNRCCPGRQLKAVAAFDRQCILQIANLRNIGDILYSDGIQLT